MELWHVTGPPRVPTTVVRAKVSRQAIQKVPVLRPEGFKVQLEEMQEDVLCASPFTCRRATKHMQEARARRADMFASSQIVSKTISSVWRTKMKCQKLAMTDLETQRKASQKRIQSLSLLKSSLVQEGLQHALRDAVSQIQLQ